MATLKTFGSKTFASESFAGGSFFGGSGSGGSSVTTLSAEDYRQIEGYGKDMMVHDAQNRIVPYIGDYDNRAVRVSLVHDETAGSDGTSSLPSEWGGNGRKSSIGTTPVQITASNVMAMRGILVRASPDNTGRVFVGKDNTITADSADSTDGYLLQPGDSVPLPLSNANLVWVVGSASGQKVFWLAI